jgi:hypothetical protein
MLALRTVAIVCSAFFLLALAPTETSAIQIDGDLTTTIEVDADGQYVFSVVSDGGSRLWIDGAVVIDDAGTHPLGPMASDPDTFDARHARVGPSARGMSIPAAVPDGARQPPMGGQSGRSTAKAAEKSSVCRPRRLA